MLHHLSAMVESGFISPDTQCIGDAVDVVEPGGDERDLQDSQILEAHFTQPGVMAWMNPAGVTGQLNDIVEHRPIGLTQLRLCIVTPQCGDQSLIESHLTQKLCVRLRSVEAVVDDRDHGRDHLVLGSRQGQGR